MPLWTPPLAVPAGVVVINLLSVRSSFPLPVMLTVATLLAPDAPAFGEIFKTPPDTMAPDARTLFTTAVPAPDLVTVTAAGARFATVRTELAGATLSVVSSARASGAVIAWLPPTTLIDAAPLVASIVTVLVPPIV